MNSFRKYLIDISQYPLLDGKTELELARRYRDGDMEARQALINSNLKLVVSIAKNYKNAHLSLSDLIMEGNLGLITAVEKYNPDLGYRFSTCATPWIKQAISKAITDKGRNIRIPAHIYQLLAKFRQALSELESDGHIPSDSEIADKMGIAVEKVADLRVWRQDTISLETPLGDDGHETIGDLQADLHTETPYEYTAKQLLKDKIQKVLGQFKPRSQQVIKLRYGLGADGDPEEFFQEHTLEQVGDYLGITRERVRQIEKQTLNEMRLVWDRVR